MASLLDPNGGKFLSFQLRNTKTRSVWLNSVQVVHADGSLVIKSSCVQGWPNIHYFQSTFLQLFHQFKVVGLRSV